MFEPISELAEINPPLRAPTPERPDAPISFIPMGDVSESGQWLARQIRPLREAKSGFTSFQEGDVLFAKITPCMENGKGAHAIGLENQVGFGSTEFHVLRAKADNSPRYIFHLSQSSSLRLKAAASMIGSAGQKRVPSDFFLKHQVFAPNSAEQRLIARILDTLDIQIQKTEALIAKLEKVKEGLLHDLLTRGIDENGQLRPSYEQAPELYKESPLGLIPREWEVVGFLDAVELPLGQVSPLIEPYTSLPLIAPDHIEAGTSRLIRVETARDQGSISGKYIVRPGDVVYSKIRPYLRKAWLAEIDSICSADMYPLSPKLLTSAILLRIVMSENFSTYANAASMRTGIPKINREELAGYTFALPTMQEQVRMENIFQEIERRADKERDTLSKLVSEKDGLMDDLLTGRVRVTSLLEKAQATTLA